MKTRDDKRTNRTLLAALAISLLLGIYGGQANAQASIPASPAITTTETVPAVEISPDIWVFDTKHTNMDFYINNGTTYLSYKEAAAMFRDLVWSFDQKSGNLNVSGPNRTLSWKINTRTALLNGKRHKMSAALILKNGSLSLPIRDLVNWVGGSIKMYKDNSLAVSYSILNVVSGDPKSWYWVRRDNGFVYTAIGSEMPHNIGRSAVRAYQYANMSVTHADVHSVVLQVNHNHGEPSYGNDIYKLYIYNGKLVRESQVAYYGGSSVESIAEADGLTVMLNGSDLLLVRSNGTVEKKYDLKKLGGLDEDYTVEYASVKDGILLIRPYESQTLLLIDPKLDTPVILYKELLSKEDQEFFEKWGKSPFMPPREGLQFVKREGNTFTFKHTAPTGKVTEGLTYTLTR
ncbi:hypothetical protein Back11_41570 [Paenibacillus baekrokdamisoli]|uniref:Copper amine oxidase-like N-terminal domain-containing protein n=1 Tax=Paenibacillus baekrokdamisoli TaxID=1712516 RepID=A0A3G9IWY0_9BACL|nr:stalk domain-containing protein [Paenibacillus baekrokdamisoli]MBB3068144.1 hypothetical protein [Paenibacillus baekrokdamisoli]BBH22812.1 hypothetical protein Back11_41570 [Paenibacillus baekrokdamisoli]